MINSYNDGLMTIHWLRWCQFITVLRFVFPILLHLLEFSVVEVVSPVQVSLESDLPSIVLIVTISGGLLAISYITPEYYRPNNRYASGILDVIQQIVLVDLTFRFLMIPYFYILHYLCINGYVAHFVNKCLFLLYAVDGKVPVSKFVRMSRTEEGFEHTRYLISYFLIIFGLYLCNFHQAVTNGLVKVIKIITNLLKEVTNKKKRSRKKK